MTEIDAEIDAFGAANVRSHPAGVSVIVRDKDTTVTVHLHEGTADELHASLSTALGKPCAPTRKAA